MTGTAAHEELFIIHPAAWRALSPEAVDATVASLKELDLYRLPYDRVAVQIGFDEAFEPNPTAGPAVRQKLGPRSVVLFHGLSLTSYERCEYIFTPTRSVTSLPGPEATAVPGERLAGTIAPNRLVDGLITLLATKNAVKERRESKLAALGIGKRNPLRRFRYSTTITVPEELEADPEHPPTGRTVCPHLRRGHIRRQHYGPGRAYVKQVWIEPCFVNADPGFVSTRAAYNLGKIAP